MFLVWVDDCALIGPEHLIKKEQERFQSLFDTTDEGNMKEYVGCKVTRTNDSIKLTQPVKFHRFEDEFRFNGGGS